MDVDGPGSITDSFLQTEIEIKDEPLDIDINDDFCYEDNESWPLEPIELVTVKQEVLDEEEEDVAEDALQPITTLDENPTQQDYNISQPSYIYIKVKVEKGKKIQQLNAYSDFFDNEEVRDSILRKNRERVALHRALETEVQRCERLKKDRERKAKQRAEEKKVTEVYQERLKRERERTAEKRLRWSVEKREENLRKDREHKRMKRLETKIETSVIGNCGGLVTEDGHMEEGMFVCCLCQYSCESHFSFKEHCMSHYQNSNFFCNYCGEGFYYRYDLTQHELIHTNGAKPFKCDHCLSEYTSLQNLLKHRRWKHRVWKSMSTGSEDINHGCNEHHDLFHSHMGLSIHSRTHSKEVMQEKTPFLCEICGKIVTTLQGFQNHHRIHTGEKPYVCKECGKRFTAYVGLHYHSRTHTGAKPYKCNECGRSFSQRSSFVVHTRIHTGEKPYSCEICGKSFITSTLLRIHKKSHQSL